MTERIHTWWLEGHPLFSTRWTHNEDWSELTWIGRATNVYHRYTRWFRPFGFWRYVLDRDLHGGDGYWTVVRCRLRGHPHGEVYFNAVGMEPDHHCTDCGELIG